MRKLYGLIGTLGILMGSITGCSESEKLNSKQMNNEDYIYGKVVRERGKLSSNYDPNSIGIEKNTDYLIDVKTKDKDYTFSVLGTDEYKYGEFIRGIEEGNCVSIEKEKVRGLEGKTDYLGVIYDKYIDVGSCEGFE